MSDRVRQAASVIAARQGGAGPEVLVLERSPGSRFLPGYVVFPGGAADPGDAQLAERWFGSPDETARACGVRELAEEAGLALTAGGLVTSPALDPVDAAPPRAGQLSELARWIAPEDVPVRFDARYFAVSAPMDLAPTADGVEAVDAWWISPRALLKEWRAGDRKLYWPTWFTVSALARVASVDELLALRIRTRDPDDDEVARMPRSVFWQD